MKNQKHFIACVAPRTAYIPEFDSLESTYSSNCAIGKFQAKHTIKALVTDTATETDKWRVVNIPTSLNMFDSIAVLGAVDEEEALTLAIQHKHRNFDSMNRDKCHVIETSTSALKRHLDNLSTMYVTPWGLSAEQDVLTRMKPQYDSLSPNGIGLLKTGYYSNYDSLLHEIASNDDDGLLMQPIKDIAQHVFDIGGVVPEYDAIYGAFQHLDAFMKLLYGAMESAKGNLELKNFEISKPFKRNGVAQVAVTFNLDDGQTLTIFFHNPEVTPAMLKGDSIVISWRYLLNKRDITGVIQPNQGEGISIPQIAGRMMQLANANSKRFKRTNERKAQQQQQLIDLQKSVEDKEAQSQQLDAKIQDLQAKIQEKAKGQAQEVPVVLAEKVRSLMNDYFQYLTSSTFLSQFSTDYQEKIKAEFSIRALQRRTNSPLEIEFSSLAVSSSETAIFSSFDSNEKDSIQLEVEEKTTLMDVKASFDAIIVQRVTQYVENSENKNIPTSKFSDDDVQYLKDLISGKADATNADMDKIVYLAEIDGEDSLLNEAMDIITTALKEASA